MAITAQLTLSAPPLPTGQALNASAFAQEVVQSIQATLSGNFLTGQIDGPTPTQNVGPWLNNGVWYVWDSGTSTYVIQAIVSNPAGVILLFGGTAAPSGYLFCDGALYLRSAFPALFAAIGTAFNPGDGVSTFGVPDMRGRVPMGSGTGTGLTARFRGDKVGTETQTLALSQLPPHSHGISDPGHNHTQNPHGHVVTDPGHSHNIFVVQNTTTPGGTFPAVGATANNQSGVSVTNVGVAPVTPSNNPSVTNITTVNSGSGGSHPNIQPSLACGFIIKT